VVGVAKEKGHPDVTVVEEKEQIMKSSPVEEEHIDDILTPWDMDLNMLEDWLENP
jgi:hypothetical protein